MKKALIFSMIIMALLFAGCFPVPSMPAIENIQIKVTGFEQEVYCGSKSFSILNGEKCPPCATCCPECPTCETCEECQECETCPDIPTCPSCPCYGLKWGNLYVDLEVSNLGNVDSKVEEICLTVFFEDDTTITKCVDVEYEILVGEVKEERAKVILPSPIKRVVLVELNP